jgi:hypothetical protein
MVYSISKFFTPRYGLVVSENDILPAVENFSVGHWKELGFVRHFVFFLLFIAEMIRSIIYLVGVRIDGNEKPRILPQDDALDDELSSDEDEDVDKSAVTLDTFKLIADDAKAALGKKQLETGTETLAIFVLPVRR